MESVLKIIYMKKKCSKATSYLIRSRFSDSLRMVTMITKAMGPRKNPANPNNLIPIYIAINVKMGRMPIRFPSNFGSKHCLVI